MFIVKADYGMNEWQVEEASKKGKEANEIEQEEASS